MWIATMTSLTAFFIVVLFSLVNVSSSKIEVTCSVFLYGQYDWGTPYCKKTVRDARELCGGKHIHFVPNHMWYSSSKNIKLVEGFCYLDKQAQQCSPISKGIVKEFEIGMKDCLREARRQGFTSVEITPHIDDAKNGVWRHTLRMDPFKKGAEGLSYYEIMVIPLMRALQTSGFDSEKVYFSLQGEMTMTLLAFPTEWTAIYKQVKNATSFNLGASVNFNNICGSSCTSFNAKKIRDLFMITDYIGISNYAPMTTKLDSYEFENGLRVFDNEIRALGMSLNMFYRHNPKFRMHYSEIGIGGGMAYNVPASSPTQAVMHPYAGMTGAYDRKNDPWQVTAMANFKRFYYKQLIKWCSEGTGPLYKVSHIHLWNVASWDHVGLYRASSSASGSYRDTVVCELIKSWNDLSKTPKK